MSRPHIFLGLLVCLCAHAQNPLREKAAEKAQGPVEAPRAAKHFPETPSGLPEWKSYLLNVSNYQKAYPGIYLPLDLVRWDKLPIEWLRAHVRKHARAWERLEARALPFEERRTERVVLSRQANQELFEAFKALEKNGTLWIGSTRAFLDSVPASDRLSLTPIDDAFQQSDFGGQIFKQIREKRSELATGFFVDPAKKRVVLELGENDYVKLEFDDSKTDEVRVRAFLGREQRLGPDLKMRKENFRGYLLNAQSGEKLPLGPYPVQGQRWVDERGTSHFKGDGHKH